MDRISIKEGSPIQVTLRVKKVPKFIIACLITVLIGVLFLPLFGIFFALTFGDGPHFGFLIGLLFFGLIARFLVRTICWNLYGSEEWTISEREVCYVADYKYFKGRTAKLEAPYALGFIRQYEDEKNKLQLTADSEIDEITSVIKISKSDAIQLADQLPVEVSFLY